MKILKLKYFLSLSFWFLLPLFARAQGFASDVQGLNSVLDQLYTEMIPLSSQLIGVGRGIAGFAAMWYIASRVWRHIANAEQIDFYPLLRPFVIGFAVLIFPSVLAMMNGVLNPTVSATAFMVKDTNQAIQVLLKQKEAAIKNTGSWQIYVGIDGSGDQEKWYKYTHPDGADEGWLEGIGSDIRFAMEKSAYNFRNSIKQWLSEILQILFEAAALAINTLRTFYLIVLAILGPLVFGIAVFDGFQHTLTIWIARYINVYLWLPVANIFGSIIAKIQENMLKIDISQIESYADTLFSATDTAYLIFLIIGIIGYFTVPNVANYIVHAGGGNALLYKVSNLFASTNRAVVAAGVAGAGMGADVFGNAASRISSSMADFGSSAPYFNDGGKDQQKGHMADKLSGKT